MFYAILTTPGKGGMPFAYGDTDPTAPGETLRVADSVSQKTATFLAMLLKQK